MAAAGLRQSPHAPVQGIAAQRALRLAEAAIQRLGAQVNPKIVLSVFAAQFRALEKKNPGRHVNLPGF